MASVMNSVRESGIRGTAGIQATVADAIESTLEWLDRQGCGGTAQERRVTGRSRYRVMARISYLPAGGERGAMFQVATRNLSRTGVSFVHKTLIYPGQSVEVHLPLPDRSIRNLKGRVVRVRGAGTGLYEIGVEFTEMEVAVS
jgi:hypothetical protein